MAKKELDEELVYVYVFLCELEGTLRGICKVNTNYEGLEEILESWRDIPDKKFEKYCASAKAGIKKLMELEPTLAEGKGILEASVVEKNIVVLKRRNWERRVAVCANADYPVIKRIPWSDVYDFGEEWFGVPCSEEYWDAVCEAYDFLRDSIEEWTPNLIGKEILKIRDNPSHNAYPFLHMMFLGMSSFYLMTCDFKKRQTIIELFDLAKFEKNMRITAVERKSILQPKSDLFPYKYYIMIWIEKPSCKIACMLEQHWQKKEIEMKVWFEEFPFKKNICSWE